MRHFVRRCVEWVTYCLRQAVTKGIIGIAGVDCPVALRETTLYLKTLPFYPPILAKGLYRSLYYYLPDDKTGRAIVSVKQADDKIRR